MDAGLTLNKQPIQNPARYQNVRSSIAFLKVGRVNLKLICQMAYPMNRLGKNVWNALCTSAVNDCIISFSIFGTIRLDPRTRERSGIRHEDDLPIAETE